MPPSIHRLPSSATRLIGSQVVVITPVLLVKELLDNSIDARATYIEILISSDTISRIEVRDDGAGIHPDDYGALGRHGHTSKLRNVEELGSVVGKTLGFRGEALASINSTAEITITTKTSTEPVATVLQLVPNEGGVLTKRSISAPRGTTVAITKLFSHQPVRKKMAVKDAKKNLDKVQELLRTYAMARPQLKLQFKIQQPQTKIWSYSPKHNTTVVEAALQLFGAEVASKCFLQTFHAGGSSTACALPARGTLLPVTNNFALEAFIANPDVNLEKVPKRHYFSVDGRPINPGRGIAKRLLNIYLEHLKCSQLVRGVSDCFIRLDMRCPTGSYDANIEPTKDDVLFSDEQGILDAFGQFCVKTYKPGIEGHKNTLNTTNTQVNNIQATKSLRSGKLYPQLGSQSQFSSSAPSLNHLGNLSITPLTISNHGAEQSVDQTRAVDEVVSDQRPFEGQASITFKPINAVNIPNIRQSSGASGPQDGAFLANKAGKCEMLINPNECSGRNNQQRHQAIRVPLTPRETIRVGHANDCHLSPGEGTKVMGLNNEMPLNSDPPLRNTPLSPLTPERPILHHSLAPPRDLDVPGNHKGVERTKLHCPRRSIAPNVPYRNPMANHSDNRPQGVPAAPPRRRRRKLPPWTPPSSVEKDHHIERSRINPTQTKDADGFKQTRILFNSVQPNRQQSEAQGGVPQAQMWSRGPHGLGANALLNMENIFSTAKQNLQYQLENDHTKADNRKETQQCLQQISRQGQPFGILHTNTFKNNEDHQTHQEPITTSLPTGDPRAYLLRRQKSMTEEERCGQPKKLRRMNSSLLPFENIPTDSQTLSLAWTISIDGPVLENLIRSVRKYDEYVICGTIVDGIDMSLADGREVESRLKKLLTEQKENISQGDGGNSGVIINLQATLKGKGVPGELMA